MENWNIITIELKDGQTGYNAVEKYITRYCNHNAYETVIVSMAISYDGKNYNLVNDIAFPEDHFVGFEFLHDWWEGEKFIKILGIKGVSELEIHGGLYEEGEK